MPHICQDALSRATSPSLQPPAPPHLRCAPRPIGPSGPGSSRLPAGEVRALGTRDRTQCLGDGDRPGNGAEGESAGAPEPNPGRPFARRVGPPGRPEFISSSLTRPAPPRRARSPSLTRPPPPPPLSPVIVPAQPLSLRPSSRVPLPPGVCLGPALRARLSALRLHLSGAPLPRPLRPARPPQPLQSRQLGPGAPRTHWPDRSPPAPPAGPLRAPPFTQSLAPALRREGAARPGPALPPAGPTPAPAPGPALI